MKRSEIKSLNMPNKRANRNRKRKQTNTNNSSSSTQNDNSSSTGQKSSKKNTKKVKKMDQRGPHWKANLDYSSSTTSEKKKNYPVIKGTQAFDLQHEYQNSHKKFLGQHGNLNELFEILKTPLSRRKNTKDSPNSSGDAPSNPTTSASNQNESTNSNELSVDGKLNQLNLFIAKTETKKVSSLPKLANKLGYSALHHICESENHDSEILDWFLETFSSIDISIDIQNRFLQTPLHLAIIYGLPAHVKILIMHNADPRVVTVDGYNGVDLAKMYLPKEMDLVQTESLNQDGKSHRMEVLNLVESAVNEIEELERDTNTITTEYSEVPSYPEKVQKYLLVNGNNMQVENIEAFTRHLGGDMSRIQEAHDKRIIVKIQKPTLGVGVGRDSHHFIFLNSNFPSESLR